MPQPIGEASVPVPDTGSQKKRPLSRANMTKNTKDRAIVLRIPHRIREQSVDVTAYESMVSYLRPETGQTGKRHTESAVLYFDYPIGKDDIYPDYKNNREEIDKIDRIMVPLQDKRFYIGGAYPYLRLFFPPTDLTATMNGWQKRVRGFLPITCGMHTAFPATWWKFLRWQRTGKDCPIL